MADELDLDALKAQIAQHGNLTGYQARPLIAEVRRLRTELAHAISTLHTTAEHSHRYAVRIKRTSDDLCPFIIQPDRLLETREELADDNTTLRARVAELERLRTEPPKIGTVVEQGDPPRLLQIVSAHINHGAVQILVARAQEPDGE